MWLELEILGLSEVNQTVKDKHHMIPLVCGILKKTGGINELTSRIETDAQALKTNLQLPEGPR